MAGSGILAGMNENLSRRGFIKRSGALLAAAPAFAQWILALVLPSSEKGARPVVRLAAAPELDGVNGRYFDKFREAAPSAAARNDSDAARLWEVADRATA